MLLSTGFLFALLVSLSEARCRLGFERRVDAAIYQPAFKAKTPSQSSEHGVVATSKKSHFSSSFSVEGHVRLLRCPDPMKQNGQLTRYRNHGFVPGLLATSCG